MLRTENLKVKYGEAEVLRGVTVEARDGKVTCILGANGSGKTTLVRAILGLAAICDGSVKLEDEDITELPVYKRVGKGIGCIPEGRRLFGKMSVEENLRIGAYLRDERDVRRKLEETYEKFPKLKKRARQLVGTMSGGEQALVALGRANMGSPKILMIDEPSLGLSPALMKESFALIKALNASGQTILLVEQNVTQTLKLADYGYVLAQGRVVAEGSTEELKGSREVSAAYFGGKEEEMAR